MHSGTPGALAVDRVLLGDVMASVLRSFRVRLGVVALTLLTVAALAPAAPAATASYTNPVSKDFADTFADPAVIKGKDGFWYAFGTTDPLREGEATFHTIPIARSRNLVDWRYVGDAFSSPQEVSWPMPTPASGRPTSATSTASTTCTTS